MERTRLPTFFCCIALFLVTASIQAQILLWPPCVSGSSGYSRSLAGLPATQKGDLSDEHRLYVDRHNGFMFNTSIYLDNGIIEFDANQTACGGILPTADMTEHNWTARLCNLEVVTARHTSNNFFSYPFVCDLHGLPDFREDCEIEFDEWQSHSGFIRHLFSDAPDPGTVYTDIDVTDQLRNDLFGPGSTDLTTGFILKTELGNYDLDWAQAVFDSNKPYIAIHVDTGSEPTKTPPPMSTSSPTPTPLPSFTPLPTPSPDASPSITPLPTITPSPGPGEDVPIQGVVLRIPAQHFVPGMVFQLDVDLYNSGFALTDVCLFVILEVHGLFFYFPDWNDLPDLSRIKLDVYSGVSRVPILRPFTWPDTVDGMAQARFLGAMTDPTVSRIIGSMDSVEFTWGNR